MTAWPANNTLQRTGGTAVCCGSVAQSEAGDSSAPAAERGALGVTIIFHR
jgi:hypothetical protein